LLAHTGPSSQPFIYVGRFGVRAESGGLYHMRARYFDPETGRFLGRDPVWPVLEEPHGLNPYQYALGNPVQFIDPTGRLPETDDSFDPPLMIADTSPPEEPSGRNSAKGGIPPETPDDLLEENGPSDWSQWKPPVHWRELWPKLDWGPGMRELFFYIESAPKIQPYDRFGPNPEPISYLAPELQTGSRAAGDASNAVAGELALASLLIPQRPTSKADRFLEEALLLGNPWARETGFLPPPPELDRRERPLILRPRF
jgi:RHS repeat-associated protein